MTKTLIILLVCLPAVSSIAQNKYADSLKTVLAATSEPIEQFALINKIIDNNDARQGVFQDTVLGIHLFRIAHELENDSLLAISINVIGNYFRGKGEFPTALEYFFKAIPLAEKAKDKRRISSLYFDIAECYFNLQNLEDCFKYNKKGEDNLPGPSSPMYDFMVSQYYRTIGNYYLKKNQPDSALSSIHKLQEVNRRLKKANYQLVEFTQNGTAYAQLGDHELAEMYFRKANVLADSIGTPQILINARLNYIPYLLGTNQIEKARQHALQLLKIGTQVNNNTFKLKATGFLSTVYSKMHRPDSAYLYLQMESALKDSVFSQSNLNKIQSLAFNDEIREIDEQAKLAEAREEREQTIQLILIAFGIIAFFIVFLLLSRSLITNTKMIEFLGVLALLIVFEFLNLLLHPFLERVTHHSPVLMLLALVCIAALLVPLHHKIEHWATIKLVAKNREIRLAAAKKTIKQLDPKNENTNT